mmetsp:Transcript_15437/g.51797  ORF Transcript_15437/g.51797 Transcript_15437/m.51797 type:complete len:102 (+) Transcript_15437:929-1234(+)
MWTIFSSHGSKKLRLLSKISSFGNPEWVIALSTRINLSTTCASKERAWESEQSARASNESPRASNESHGIQLFDTNLQYLDLVEEREGVDNPSGLIPQRKS